MPEPSSPPARDPSKEPAPQPPQTAGEVAALAASPEFKLLLQRYEERTGIKLQLFNIHGAALTDVETPPAYCVYLQEHQDCPLYFRRDYLKASAEGMKPCVASVGHLVAPVLDHRGQQIATVVSQALRFGRNPVEPLSQKAFQHKIFPDDFINAANAVREAPTSENRMFIGEFLSLGLQLLVEHRAKERVSAAVAALHSRVAEADAQTLGQQVVEAALQVVGGDYALAVLFDDSGRELSTGYDQPSPDHLVETKRRLLEGVSEWVRHADRHVIVPDVAASAWCRYLTGAVVDGGSIVGVPIVAGERNLGAVVVAFDNPRDDLQGPLQALQQFVEQGVHAIAMGRKLVQTDQSAMVDPATGVYNQRLLDDLLEREISRAARAGRDLSLVLFHVDDAEILANRLGEEIWARVLREMTALIRSRTRRANTLARIGTSDFCLVVPEASRAVAARLAEALRRAVQDHPFSTPGGDEILRLKVDVGFATSEQGHDDREGLLEKARTSLRQARAERLGAPSSR
jgi:diguanylate cyclase (GGDEF)-like protein